MPPEKPADCAFELGLDHVLLDRCRGGVRIWSPRERAVVLGVSSRVRGEIRTDACSADGIRILRRFSGGATVLVTPKVVCFSVYLPYELFADAKTIGGAYRVAVRTLAAALRRFGIETGFERPCDITVGLRKLVGMAQARRRAAALVHGVVPVDLSVADVERYLAHPSEEPAYRAGRPHRDFMTTMCREVPACTRQEVGSALREAFAGEGLMPAEPGPAERAEADRLALSRYGSAEWIYRR